MRKNRKLAFILLCLLILGIEMWGVEVGSRAQGAAKPTSRRLFTAAGAPTDPSFFPIAVWLQDPSNAARYAAAGFNLYVGLWQGPTEAQLAALRAAGMPLICERNDVGMAHLGDPMIAGWMHQDEPDNAQPITDPKTGKETYGPCVPPARIVSEYIAWKALDPSRPIMLNLGQGVANDAWVGRGEGAKLNDYRTYVGGGDIISFDIYPVAGLAKDGQDFLWYVPKGVKRLAGWTEHAKPIWNCIECTRIGSTGKATPQQVRAEVWMSLIHGSKGLIYFVHQFQPTFNEHALLDDPPMLAEVTAINRRIRELAPILNAPPIKGGVSAKSSAQEVPIAAVARRQGRTFFVFAVGMRNGATHGAFAVRGLPKHARAEALGENRVFQVINGRFTDSFQPYEVHLYRIR
jgi:hypothetical protein